MPKPAPNSDWRWRWGERGEVLCTQCGERMEGDPRSDLETLVGFYAGDGHAHDDNCMKRRYVCENGHDAAVSLRRRCPRPDCDWAGKAECFCHPGPKVNAWP